MKQTVVICDRCGSEVKSYLVDGDRLGVVAGLEGSAMLARADLCNPCRRAFVDVLGPFFDEPMRALLVRGVL